MRPPGAAAALLLGLLAPAAASAQPAPAPEPVPPETAPAPAPLSDPAQLAAENERLRQEVEALRDDVDLLREDVDASREELMSLRALRGRLTGYLDLGFFSVGGNGSGVRSDTLHRLYPEYGYVEEGWVFRGDPLSTAVNSRGDPASTGESRAVTLNAIDATGPTFVLNALALDLFAGLGDRLSVTAFLDVLSRGRDISDSTEVFLGDFVDLKLAYVEWLPEAGPVDLTVQAGKLDSTVGYEYRIQESPDRTTVTPSLLCRYLCGHPIGVKARAQLWGQRLIAAAAITSGSNFSEGFGFADEVDRNQWPTGSARLAVRLGDPPHEVEIGLSGAYGVQDNQPDPSVRQWHTGADVHGAVGDLEFAAEAVWGKAAGRTSGAPDTFPCDAAVCLRYKAAYGQVAYRVSNALIPYVRADWRDALHLDNANFAYVSRLWRATAGLRVELGEHVIAKAEYTANRELTRGPQFADDVFTSSLVVRF